MKAGSFRQDLFYRIKTVEIPLPPLRDRREDIPALFNFYFEQFSQRYHKNLEVSKSVIDHLSKYHWPGNIRELQHAVERAVILCREPALSISDFQLVREETDIQANGSLNLVDVEREAIRKAVHKHQQHGE